MPRNAVQHLMIRRTDGQAHAAAFVADCALGDPTIRDFLGYRYWRCIGRPFDLAICVDGEVVAWTDPPFTKRVARDRCMLALVDRLKGWAA